MSEPSITTDEKLSRLRTPSGGFAMVALDQRESLREMFPVDRDGALVGDDRLTAFKKTAAAILTPFASGVLLDRPYAVSTPRRPPFIAGDCGLILAADLLHGRRGAGVLSSSLDPAVDESFIRGTGAAAIKLLVIWRQGRDAAREALVQNFLDLARRSGVASFVEGIVRPAHGRDWRDVRERHEAILQAADELSRGASVYKAEVPGYLPGNLDGVLDGALAMSSLIGRRWVVLSNGVRQEDFTEAVSLSCAGGAQGFLAGRAIWADTVAAADPAAALSDTSVKRLMILSTIVERSRSEMIDPAAPAEGEGATR